MKTEFRKSFAKDLKRQAKDKNSTPCAQTFTPYQPSMENFF
jgi:hypothetical protein